MASLRVFISSTFYDLRQIRDDLERMIKDLGYEPVRNETGAIPFGKDHPPENYAYQEVGLCNIVVSIIGGRYGSESKESEGGSISQNELRHATEKGVPLYIFVEKTVLAEYDTYKVNKGNDTVKWSAVDDPRVFEFLDHVFGLPRNNPIAEFSTSADITSYLKKQWAGLFQRFLRDQQRNVEIEVLEGMKGVAGTMQQMVKYLTEEREGKDDAIKNILLANHPAFARFATLTETPYRVFFSNLDELNTWLSARSYMEAEVVSYNDEVRAWIASRINKRLILKKSIFEPDGRLRIYDASTWQDSWVESVDLLSDDDVAF